MTRFHSQEFQDSGLEARWLDSDKASKTYKFALKFSATDRYGLSGETVNEIEAHVIDSENAARNWVRRRVNPTGKVHVVFGPDEVAVVEAKLLIDRWPDMFLPGRDDVMILHADDDSVLFYCHEEELEYGRRIGS